MFIKSEVILDDEGGQIYKLISRGRVIATEWLAWLDPATSAGVMSAPQLLILTCVVM